MKKRTILTILTIMMLAFVSCRKEALVLRNDPLPKEKTAHVAFYGASSEGKVLSFRVNDAVSESQLIIQPSQMVLEDSTVTGSYLGIRVVVGKRYVFGKRNVFGTINYFWSTTSFIFLNNNAGVPFSPPNQYYHQIGQQMTVFAMNDVGYIQYPGNEFTFNNPN